MQRKSICALVAFLFFATLACADEVKGTIKSINTKKGDVTVTVKDATGDKDVTYAIPFDAKVLDADGKESKGKKRLGIFSTGSSITLTTEKKDDKDVVTQVKLNK